MSTVHRCIIFHVCLGSMSQAATSSALQTEIWTSSLGPLLPSVSLGIQSNQPASPAIFASVSFSNSLISCLDDSDSHSRVSQLLAPASQSLPHPARSMKFHLFPPTTLASAFSSHCWHFKPQRYQTAFLFIYCLLPLQVLFPLWVIPFQGPPFS